MAEDVLTLDDIRQAVKPFAEKYKISEVYLFGSYARGEADSKSDVDFLIVGGEGFRLFDTFGFGFEMSQVLNRDVDAYEIRELKLDTPFYYNVMKDRVRVA